MKGKKRGRKKNRKPVFCGFPSDYSYSNPPTSDFSKEGCPLCTIFALLLALMVFVLYYLYFPHSPLTNYEIWENTYEEAYGFSMLMYGILSGGLSFFLFGFILMFFYSAITHTSLSLTQFYYDIFDFSYIKKPICTMRIIIFPSLSIISIMASYIISISTMDTYIVLHWLFGPAFPVFGMFIARRILKG